MRGAWKRFRALPAAAQLAAWVALAGVYTVGLVLAIGGGGDGEGARAGTGASAPVARSALERSVRETVEKSPRKKAGAGDRPSYRRPRVRRVRCDATLCDIVYSSGLPGTGRILEDQQEMVRRLFMNTGTPRIRLTVVRGTPTETGVPPKQEEETRAESILVQSECDRTSAGTVDWARASALEVQQKYCRLTDFEAGAGRSRGLPGSDPGDEGPTGPE